MGLVLDEQKESDITFELDGITFVADKEVSHVFEDTIISAREGMFGSTRFVVYSSKRTQGC